MGIETFLYGALAFVFIGMAAVVFTVGALAIVLLSTAIYWFRSLFDEGDDGRPEAANRKFDEPL